MLNLSSVVTDLFFFSSSQHDWLHISCSLDESQVCEVDCDGASTRHEFFEMNLEAARQRLAAQLAAQPAAQPAAQR